ncbi:hypothetical protein HPP92_002371 [Vanilla planifolia]|uniref:Uncharacterized protein n=1 Tax=Vanilla planifolia TaxID=51239 RepID=A0A835VIW6_VANPL|nr:hypothetical protein HPP92_002371 [Vanilla planifolia]
MTTINNDQILITWITIGLSHAIHISEIPDHLEARIPMNSTKSIELHQISPKHLKYKGIKSHKNPFEQSNHRQYIFAVSKKQSRKKYGGNQSEALDSG